MLAPGLHLFIQVGARTDKEIYFMGLSEAYSRYGERIDDMIKSVTRRCNSGERTAEKSFIVEARPRKVKMVVKYVKEITKTMDYVLDSDVRPMRVGDKFYMDTYDLTGKHNKNKRMTLVRVEGITLESVEANRTCPATVILREESTGRKIQKIALDVHRESIPALRIALEY